MSTREAMSTAEGVNLRSRVNPRSGKQRSVNRRSRKLAEQHEAMSTAAGVNPRSVNPRSGKLAKQ